MGITHIIIAILSTSAITTLLSWLINRKRNKVEVKILEEKLKSDILKNYVEQLKELNNIKFDMVDLKKGLDSLSEEINQPNFEVNEEFNSYKDDIIKHANNIYAFKDKQYSAINRILDKILDL